MGKCIFFILLGALKYEEANPDRKKDISLHALGKHAAHGDDDGLAEHYRHGEGSRSSFTEVSHTNSKEVQEEGQLMDFKSGSSLPLNTKDDAEKCSASVSWALFARRHLNASTSTSAGSSHSPHNWSANSGREHPPPCSLSTRTHQSAAPLSSLSPSTCPVSPVLDSAMSPVRDQNKGPDSSGLPGSPAGPPAQSQTCSQPKDLKLTAILVSHFFKEISTSNQKILTSFGVMSLHLCLYLSKDFLPNHSVYSPGTPSIPVSLAQPKINALFAHRANAVWVC